MFKNNSGNYVFLRASSPGICRLPLYDIQADNAYWEWFGNDYIYRSNGKKFFQLPNVKDHNGMRRDTVFKRESKYSIRHRNYEFYIRIDKENWNIKQKGFSEKLKSVYSYDLIHACALSPNGKVVQYAKISQPLDLKNKLKSLNTPDIFHNMVEYNNKNLEIKVDNKYEGLRVVSDSIFDIRNNSIKLKSEYGDLSSEYLELEYSENNKIRVILQPTLLIVPTHGSNRNGNFYKENHRYLITYSQGDKYFEIKDKNRSESIKVLVSRGVLDAVITEDYLYMMNHVKLARYSLKDGELKNKWELNGREHQLFRKNEDVFLYKNGSFIEVKPNMKLTYEPHIYAFMQKDGRGNKEKMFVFGKVHYRGGDVAFAQFSNRTYTSIHKIRVSTSEQKVSVLIKKSLDAKMTNSNHLIALTEDDNKKEVVVFDSKGKKIYTHDPSSLNIKYKLEGVTCDDKYFYYSKYDITAKSLRVYKQSLKKGSRSKHIFSIKNFSGKLIDVSGDQFSFSYSYSSVAKIYYK